MLRLKPLRKRKPSLADKLNYACVVEDGIVLNKDGSLMAGWYYQGLDISSSTDDELNTLTERLNAALARLGSGWMTHHDAVRFEARGYPADDESFFPDPITRAIDAERRAQFEAEGAHFETMYALIVTYLPPRVTTRRLADMMFDESEDDAKRKIGTRVLESFKLQIAELEDALSVAPLQLHRMRGEAYIDEWNQTHVNDQLLQYLNFTISGDNHPVNLPPVPMYMDAVLGIPEFFPGTRPKVGNQLVRVITINGFPKESTPAILAALDRLPFTYRWSTRFIYMDPEESRKHLTSFRRKWEQKVRGFLDQIMQTSRGPLDADAAKMVTETEDALAEASGQEVTFGYYTSAIVLMSELPALLEEWASYVRRSLNHLGFACMIETLNCVEAWLGTLPGDGVHNVRRPLLNSLNLSDFLPIASIWAGRDRCPCPLYPADLPPLLHAATEGATPFRMNLHVGDLGHTLITGPTGSGKSVLLAFLIAQFRRYPRATIFAFDKGRSLYAITKAAGGSHFEIGGEGVELTLMPLARLDTDADRAWAEEWITLCAEMQLGVGKSNTSQKVALRQAVKLLADAPRNERTITNCVTNIQDKELRAALEYYTVSGPAGKILDGDRDDVTDGNFQTFEMESLMGRGENVVLPTLLYLFRRIDIALKGQPASIWLDESWMYFGHPVFRDKLREWLKVKRKENCIVVMATQSISDSLRSGIYDVLLESCPTKILLPNDRARDMDDNGQGPRALYGALGLNPRQIDIIADAVPKREYYFMSPEGRRLIRLNLGRTALAFVGVSSKEDVVRVKEMERKHGARWPIEWLRARGISTPDTLIADAANAGGNDSRSAAAVVVPDAEVSVPAGAGAG